MARLFPLTLSLNLSSSSFYFLGSFPTNANHPLRRHQPRPCYLYLKPRYLKCCLSSSFRRPRPDGDGNRIGFVQRLSRWMMLYCDFMPGGRWWHFPHHFQDQKEEASESGETNVVTTLSALQRMWQLFENDRWVFFAGLITLILAAVRPHNLFFSGFISLIPTAGGVPHQKENVYLSSIRYYISFATNIAFHLNCCNVSHE
ncbi:hypothetical protein ACLOJK_022841 [Asimina triloba]